MSFKPEDVETIRERVKKTLERYPSTRDDRNMLAVCYWKLWDNLNVWIDNMNKLTPVESITRAARKIQNEEKQFLPTPQVKAKREAKQNQYSKYYGRKDEIEW